MGERSIDGSGHRARLRRRLFEGGADALLDHELVEYLLALALPRRDTKPLAKRLIEDFGGFGALLSADAEAIARIGDVSEGAAAAIKIARDMAEEGFIHLSTADQIAGVCNERFAGRTDLLRSVPFFGGYAEVGMLLTRDVEQCVAIAGKRTRAQ